MEALRHFSSRRAWDRRRGDALRSEATASYYWRNNLHATFINDPAGLRLIDEIGPDRVMWSNDYPHQESVYGRNWTAIQQGVDAVTEDDARKMLGGNAVKLYRLD